LVRGGEAPGEGEQNDTARSASPAASGSAARARPVMVGLRGERGWCLRWGRV